MNYLGTIIGIMFRLAFCIYVQHNNNNIFHLKKKYIYIDKL